MPNVMGKIFQVNNSLRKRIFPATPAQLDELTRAYLQNIRGTRSLVHPTNLQDQQWLSQYVNQPRRSQMNSFGLNINHRNYLQTHPFQSQQGSAFVPSSWQSQGVRAADQNLLMGQPSDIAQSGGIQQNSRTTRTAKETIDQERLPLKKRPVITDVTSRDSPTLGNHDASTPADNSNVARLPEDSASRHLAHSIGLREVLQNRRSIVNDIKSLLNDKNAMDDYNFWIRRILNSSRTKKKFLVQRVLLKKYDSASKPQITLKMDYKILSRDFEILNWPETVPIENIRSLSDEQLQLIIQNLDSIKIVKKAELFKSIGF